MEPEWTTVCTTDFPVDSNDPTRRNPSITFDQEGTIEEIQMRLTGSDPWSAYGWLDVYRDDVGGWARVVAAQSFELVSTCPLADGIDITIDPSASAGLSCPDADGLEGSFAPPAPFEWSAEFDSIVGDAVPGDWLVAVFGTDIEEFCIDIELAE